MFIQKLLKTAMAVGLAVGAGQALAQEAWPSKPIRIIVPFSAGGPIDGAARILGAKLQDALGESVIIENIGGGGGGIGTQRASRAAGDGYTFLLAHVGTLSILPHVNKEVGYDPLKDFTPVSELGGYATILVVNADEPYKTMEDLIKAGKANPGKINYGSSGVGSSGHLSAALMSSMADVDFSHVPYKGNAPAMMDLVAGRITFMFDVLLNSAPQIEAGKVRALGISNHTGLKQLPGVPPMSKTIPNYEVVGWIGLVGPAGVPKNVVDRMHSEIEKITKMPDFVEKYASYGFEAGATTPQNFGARLKSDYALWGKAVQSAGPLQ